MRDWNLLLDKALAIVPLSWQQRTSELAGEADEVVGAFLRGQFLVMCALGAIYSAGLWLVGLQLAMLLGFDRGSVQYCALLGLYGRYCRLADCCLRPIQRLDYVALGRACVWRGGRLLRACC